MRRLLALSGLLLPLVWSNASRARDAVDSSHDANAALPPPAWLDELDAHVPK